MTTTPRKRRSRTRCTAYLPDAMDALGRSAVHAQPTTALEALMQARPNEEPTLSREEELELDQEREFFRVDAALKELTGVERYIIQRHVMEMASLATVAHELDVSKTTVWRRRQSALRKLREALS